MTETTTTNETGRVLELVRCVDLEYPDGQLLECFLLYSIDPLQTARYILGRCSAEGDGLDLAALLSDWKRLISVCMCVQPKYLGSVVLMMMSSYI